jgi:hypothetical protein
MFRKNWQSILNKLLLSSLFFGVTASTVASPLSKESWLEFSDARLGISFKYPSSYRVWQANNEVFLDQKLNVKNSAEVLRVDDKVDLLMNGRHLNHDGKYLVHFTLGQGNFSHANQEIGVFEKRGKSLRLTLGRFRNPPAQKIQTSKWMGYQSSIICSTQDEETGFHAAGGVCYWSLISNGAQFLLVDTQLIGPYQEKLVHTMVRSVNFLK